jgi:hypothetical protein
MSFKYINELRKVIKKVTFKRIKLRKGESERKVEILKTIRISMTLTELNTTQTNLNRGVFF